MTSSGVTGSINPEVTIILQLNELCPVGSLPLRGSSHCSQPVRLQGLPQTHGSSQRKCGYGIMLARSLTRHPRMFVSGVQVRLRLDSRLKHAGMTGFGMEANSTRQASGMICYAI
jgi:hypothetical protein